MPRIRRWHPVSHDLNGDPEVWELTERFGDRALRVWLEILSITDRTQGVLRGQREHIESTLGGRCRMARKTIRGILDYCLDKTWLLSEDALRVRNYPEFHRTKEHKKSHEETIEAPSEPSRPSDPSSSPPSTPLVPPVGQEPNGLPDWLREVLTKSEHFKHLAEGHAKFWRTMNTRFDQYEWLGWDEEVQKADVWCASNPQKAPTPRGCTKFLRNWFENAVEYGRKKTP